jgi:hypothetical protein
MKIKGVDILENTPGGDYLSQCHLGEKLGKVEEKKGENAREKERKGKKMKESGKKRRKGEVKGENKCKIGLN